MTPLDRTRLAAFLQVPERGLSLALKRLGLPARSRRFSHGLVWKSLGLAPDQDPARWDELSAPLPRAAEVGAILGVDTSTVYKWHGGKPPRPDCPPMPRAIDLGRGEAGARGLRWRHAEIAAWDLRDPPPVHRKAAPLFGSLLPPS